MFFEDGETNSQFLKEVKDFIEGLRDDYKLGVIVGGGDIARKYIKVAEELGFDDDQKDEIAIACTRINATLLKLLVLNEKDIKKKIEEMKREVQEEGITIAGGTVPGHTTDKVSTLLASEIGCKRILNLTDVEGVYTKDPDKFEDAELIEKLSWGEFFDVVGKIKHSPGLNLPFEPQAGKLCQEEGIEVGVTYSLKEAEKFIKGKAFKGTLIW